MTVPDDGEERPEPHSGGPFIDYRFSLANERTYLAWTRTALALIAGGVAVLRLLADSETGFIAAYILVGLGILVAVAGLRRWRRNEQAMLNGWGLEATRLPIVLAIGLSVVGVLLLFD
jgi:putative membrane protein